MPALLRSPLTFRSQRQASAAFIASKYRALNEEEVAELRNPQYLRYKAKVRHPSAAARASASPDTPLSVTARSCNGSCPSTRGSGEMHGSVRPGSL